MSRREEERKASSGTLIKAIILLYCIFCGVAFVKEFVFTRADTSSHVIGIVVGVILLVLTVILSVSTVKGIGASRKYYQKNGRAKPVDYSKTDPYLYGKRNVSGKKNGHNGK